MYIHHHSYGLLNSIILILYHGTLFFPFHQTSFQGHRAPKLNVPRMPSITIFVIVDVGILVIYLLRNDLPLKTEKTNQN